MAKKVNAMVVDSDADSRLRVHQMAGGLPGFGSLQMVPSLAEALKNLNSRLDSQPDVDLVFLSHRFEKNSINQFVQLAKDTNKGRSAAYILLLQDSSDEVGVSSGVLQGADGVLVEPFCKSSVCEILTLSESVKRQRNVVRGEALIDFLCSDIIKKIDDIAIDQMTGRDPSENLTELRDLEKVVADLGSDKIPLYQKKIIVMLVASQPNPEIEKWYKKKMACEGRKNKKTKTRSKSSK